MKCSRFLSLVFLAAWTSGVVATEPAVIERTVRVQLRDGVRLSTDLYLPAAEGRFPTLLMRTPYNKNRVQDRARRLTAFAYAVVIQDCRGRNESEGEFYAYIHEGPDGFDTQEWVGTQPWSDGKIGTFGGSYVGGVQWLAAPYGSRYVKAMAPRATFSNFYHNLYLGGALRVGLIGSWCAGMTAPTPEARAKIDLNQSYLHQPLYKMDETFGWRIPMLRDWVAHTSYDDYWRQLDVEDKFPELDLPAYHIVGYYDFFLPETIKSYKMMARLAKTEHARRNQKMILGPWDHGTIGKRQVGEIDFGPQAMLDWDLELKRWFDRQLKGQDNGVEREPPIRYFVMGLNDWRECYRWPPQATRSVNYYLNGNAKGPTDDGGLSLTPSTSDAVDTFLSDPATPIPSKGGRGVAPSVVGDWGPWDQRGIEALPNVLVYTSPPLAHDLEVVGPVTATLFLATDARDTDLAIKLVDVFPDGYALNVATGILRGRYRNSLEAPELLTPGKLLKWHVNLTHVSNRFKAGHRIRLDVTGSNFPLYDRNPNTGGGIDDVGTFVATQKLYHSAAYPSHVTLPVSTAYSSEVE